MRKFFLSVLFLSITFSSCKIQDNVFSKLKLSESSNDPKKEAEYAFYNQNYEKAVTLLQDYVKENPHDYFGGVNLILLGDWAQIEPVKAKPL